MIETAVLFMGITVVTIICILHWWIDEEIRWSLLALLIGIYLIGWSFGESSIKAEILAFEETNIDGSTYVVEEVINNEEF
jgi:membrane protein required for beta-lactamase induction